MRITGLHVERFGIWKGLRIGELSGELTLFHGPNEAGKTTLLQFVRTVLYGFSPERLYPYLSKARSNQPDGGPSPRVGGSLFVSSAEGDYEISRSVDASRHTDGPGAARVMSADGDERRGHRLGSLLCGVDEAIFNNVFAVSLTEMQHLGSLNDTDAADQLYRLSTGTDRVSLVDVSQQLECARDEMLAPHGQPSRIGDLLSNRARLRLQIEQLVAEAHGWPQLHSEYSSLADDIDATERHHRQLGQQIEVLETALSVWPKWQQRQRLGQQLQELPPRQNVSPDTVQQVRLLNQQISDRRHRWERSKKDRAELKQQAAKLPLNVTLTRQAPLIHALADQKAWISSLEDEAKGLQTKLEQLDREIESHRDKYGITGDSLQNAPPGLQRVSWRDLRGPARQLRRQRQRLRRARAEVTALREEAQQCQRQIDAVLKENELLVRSGQAWNLTSALEHFGALASNLRRRVQLDDAVSQLADHERELKQRRHRLLERQVLPMHVVIGFGCLFSLGALLLLSGLFAGSLVGDLTRVLLVLTGAAASGAAAAMTILMKRSVTEQLAACDRQYGMIAGQLKADRDECATLDQKIPTGGGPLVSRLQAAEALVLELERLLPMEAKRQTVVQQTLDEEQKAVDATTNVRTARARWRAALRTAGLAEDLKASYVRQLARHSGSLSQSLNQREDLRRQCQRRQDELSAVQRRIGHLLSDAGLEPGHNEPLAQLNELIAAVQQQEHLIELRGTLRKQSRQIRREQTITARAIRKDQRRRQKLVDLSGARDERQLEKLAEECARADELARQRDLLTREINATLAGRSSEETVVNELESSASDQLDARLDRLRRDRAASEDALKSLQHRRGELHQQIKTAAADRRLAQTRIDLNEVEKRLEHAIQQWKQLAVTGGLLTAVCKSYEKERQPDVLQEASKFLDRMTDGRYVRVWTPLSEDVLRVDDRQGQSLSVDVLSRGAREQLFLSLRLALANEYARRGVRMPLVLDDVLVNFDSQRARSAAAVLTEFSQSGHQLLVFTCHEHIVSVFQELDVAIREIPDHVELARKPSSKRKRKQGKQATPRRQRQVNPAVAAVQTRRDAGARRPDVTDPPQQWTNVEEDFYPYVYTGLTIENAVESDVDEDVLARVNDAEEAELEDEVEVDMDDEIDDEEVDESPDDEFEDEDEFADDTVDVRSSEDDADERGQEDDAEDEELNDEDVKELDEEDFEDDEESEEEEFDEGDAEDLFVESDEEEWDEIDDETDEDDDVEADAA